MVMTMCIADFAIEWLRPLPPSYKLIGAVLPEPARPLPADLEVGSPTAQIEQEEGICRAEPSLPGRGPPE